MNKKIFLSTLLALGVTSSFAVAHPRIGVLSKDCSIYGVYNGDRQKDGVMFALDTEDSNDASAVSTNDPNSSKPVFLSGGKMVFFYCAITLLEDNIPRTPFDYIVLRLDSQCPSGTYPFSRYHDTQDHGSNFNNSPLLWPSVIGESTAELKYCFVPKNPNSKLKHPFQNYNSPEVPPRYGVFTSISPISSYHYYYLIHVEDEDSNNQTKFIWGKELEKNTALQNRVQQIIYGKDNTYYRAILWPGAVSYTLPKMANAENIDTPKAELKSGSAEIKSADYNTIVFELKSAGNTKISIRNINGTEVAKINEIEKVSKPGRRVYTAAEDIPTIKSGRGMVIISTSKGLMTGREAKKNRLGGEILVRVW